MIGAKFKKTGHVTLTTPICPKKPKKGREQAFSSKTSIILKLTYLGRGSSDFDKIWHGDAVRPS